jgi:hypothetical protein
MTQTSSALDSSISPSQVSQFPDSGITIFVCHFVIAEVTKVQCKLGIEDCPLKKIDLGKKEEL